MVPDSYVDVLGVKVSYDVLGAEVNEIKFTLRPGRTEFLRVETSDRASGYRLPNDPPVPKKTLEHATTNKRCLLDPNHQGGECTRETTD